MQGVWGQSLVKELRFPHAPSMAKLLSLPGREKKKKKKNTTQKLKLNPKN